MNGIQDGPLISTYLCTYMQHMNIHSHEHVSTCAHAHHFNMKQPQMVCDRIDRDESKGNSIHDTSHGPHYKYSLPPLVRVRSGYPSNVAI